MITQDAPAILARVNAKDRAHAEIVASLRGDSGPRVVPALTLAEVP